jgi:hypothetical protein
VFDNWAKIDSGYLMSFGARFSYGHFDRCLQFRQELSRNDVIQGQHCMVRFGASETLTLPEDYEGDFDWREM